MAYEYSDPRRAEQATALPDVEVFEMATADATVGEIAAEPVDGWYDGPGYYFAFGFPGCLWDGEPSGPYETYELALEAARE